MLGEKAMNDKTEQETPRTDAALRTDGTVWANFARQLERELAALRQQQAVPEGMVLVPRVDLEHFIGAGVVGMWAKTMLAAAPKEKP